METTEGSDRGEIAVFFFEDSGEFVATCDDYPSLSWIAETPELAEEGLLKLLREISEEES